MTKLIIWIPGRPMLNGYKRREYVWSPPHDCYVYRGVEFSAAEFNEAFAKCFKFNGDDPDMAPRVRVVDSSPSVAAAPAMTLEGAEAFLAEHAPEKLKRRPVVKAEIRQLEVA